MAAELRFAWKIIPIIGRRSKLLADAGRIITEKEHSGKSIVRRLEVIANCGCDVVHICGLGWRNALLPRGNTPPIVMDHVELESSLEDVTFPRKQAQALLEWASLFAYRNTVMASNYLKSTFQTRASRFRLQRRMMVLPYASDVPATLGGMRGGAKSKLAMGGKRLILYMGRQYKNYGCLDIVEALDRLRAVRRDWHAVLLGDGPEHQRIGQNRAAWVERQH